MFGDRDVLIFTEREHNGNGHLYDYSARITFIHYGDSEQPDDLPRSHAAHAATGGDCGRSSVMGIPTVMESFCQAR